MAIYHRWRSRLAAALALGLCGPAAARAQEAPAFHPIPAAECQKFASQIQGAAGFAVSAGEDDFTDLADGSDGRSCHISGSAADQALASPGDLVAKIAKVFADWRDDPNRAADGADGAERGYVNDNRVATLDVSWEPGPGVACSDKQPLSACKILPQQKLWNVTVDIIEKPAK